MGCSCSGFGASDTPAWAFGTPDHVGVSLVLLTALTCVRTGLMVTVPIGEVSDAWSCVCPLEWLCFQG